MKTLLALLVTVIFSAQVNAQYDPCDSNGVPINGHPSWMERGMLTITNTCRLDPTGYRDYYLPGAGNILMPAHYPAVPPLRDSFLLDRSALLHCQDMIAHNYIGHNSFDGTPWPTRIGSYYPNWSLLGENVAGGFSNPVNVIGGLIADPFNGAPAPDGSGYDGHRWNIMYVNYIDLGNGFQQESVQGSTTYWRYYTQDFGRQQGAIPPYCSPIVSGAHYFLWDSQGASETHFLINYYDPNAVPQNVTLFLNNQPYPMPLHLGAPDKGTYMFVAPMISHCRFYYFEATDAVGRHWRYPSYGEFYTYLEGQGANYFPVPNSCGQDWTWCVLDFDQDGRLTPTDIFAFIRAWFISDPMADFNGNDVIDINDIVTYVNAWLSGC